MLQQLYIKNVVLIDEAIIEFDNGLNILSGETGAGKSIVIGSLAFVLGARASKSFIKKGADRASVSVLLNLKSEVIKHEIEQLGVNVDDDGAVLIDRTYTSSGRNICKVNGKPATLGMIKEICEKFIDIHGQHEHQSLLNPSKHIELLDRFCEDEMIPVKAKLLSYLIKYKKILSQIESLAIGKDREDLIDFFNYQVMEIENTNLCIGEDEELSNKRKILIEAENIKDLYTNSLELLYSGEDMSAVDRISIAINNLEIICKIDTSKEELYSELHIVQDKLSDIIKELKKYNEEIEFNDDTLNDIEYRLNVIQKLKRKYGETIQDIIRFKDETKIKLDNILDGENKILQLNNEKASLKKQIKNYCSIISNIRKSKASMLEENIEKNLHELGMENSKFKINIQNKNTFNQNGFDKVEFLICTNLGEDLNPLSKIASGGEMSRIMLSLKAVLSFVDTIDTFIFDEIDSGISGRTAQMVAEKMAYLAKTNQIICITHLPQIAVMGDNHLLINKNLKEENTITTITKIDKDDIVNEIARMTGGVTITGHTITSANEMLNLARKYKKCKS